MTRNRDSIQFSPIQFTPSCVTPRSALPGAVRQALYSPREWLRTGVIAAGLAGVIPLADGAPFPPVFPLASLLPANGGDGSAGFVLTGIDPFDYSGRSVSAAGDISGDGIDDLIIGAPDADPDGRSRAGESYVVFGSTQGFPAVLPLASLFATSTEGFVLSGIDTSDRSGASVSAAGDVNGDGIDDLIIGATFADPGGRVYAGESYVVFGSAQGFPAVLPLGRLLPAGGGDGSAGFVLRGVDEFDRSGHSVSAAGDVNRDGIDDLIVGAFAASAGGRSYAGASYVVFGSTQGFPAVLPLARLLPVGGGDGSAGFVLSGIDEADSSGHSVSAAGDISGDGIDDLIVGADNADPRGRHDAGESYVVFGSTQGFPAVLPLARLLPAGGGDGSAGFVLSGIDAEDYTGRSVSAAGDVNGDGIDDLIVGAPRADPDGRSRAGESYVVFGSTQGFPAVLPLANLFAGHGSAGFVLTGIDQSDRSGASVSAAGDVNGDGIDDLIIGAEYADPGGRIYAGESYVVFGSAQGFPAVLPLADLFAGDGSAGFVLSGIDPDDQSGHSVHAAGDVNGDGIDDLIVGAPYADPRGHHNAGESYVVFGRGAAR